MNGDRGTLVSVVIPAYNAAAFIERALDSVRVQTYSPWEIIVVDDGSTDGTQDTVARYLQRHHLPGRCVRQENKKIAGARNTGMRAARGEFIALLDSDDLWYPDKLETVMNEFRRHPEADLVCHNENIVKDGKRVRVSQYGPAVPRMYEKLLFRGGAVSPSASVVRREKALEIGGFRENPDFNTVEDYDFWLRLSRTARFHFIERALGEYQLRDASASRRIDYHHTNMECMLRDHLASYFGAHPNLVGRLRIRKRLAMVYRSALWQLMDYREFPEKQRAYALKMVRTYPLDPKNLIRALQWITSAVRSRRAQAEAGANGARGV